MLPPRLIRRPALAALACATLSLAGCFGLDDDIETATGFVAQSICSGMYISGKTYSQARREDAPDFGYVFATSDDSRRQVTASFLGVTRRSVWRDGLGCTLDIGVSADELRRQVATPVAKAPQPDPTVPWPQGNAVSAPVDGVDLDTVQRAVEPLFTLNVDEGKTLTQGVAVIHDGRLIYERYAGSGGNGNTPLLTNSMTKMLTGTLVGMMLAEGRLTLDAPAPVAEWANSADPRHAITLKNLLEMRSGLTWQEDASTSHASVLSAMLFNSYDAAARAANQPLESAPDAGFKYSTGTSTLLARLVRDAEGGSQHDRLSLVQRRLFVPLGMANSVIEPDASGTFLGGTRTFSTARDWARFGQLFLNRGQWNGQTLVSPDWIDYATTPVSSWPRPDGILHHGRHWWLNRGPDSGTSIPAPLSMPDLPADMYFARGMGENYLLIFPTQKLLVVRLGYTPARGSLMSAMNAVGRDLLRALPAPAAQP